MRNMINAKLYQVSGSLVIDAPQHAGNLLILTRFSQALTKLPGATFEGGRIIYVTAAPELVSLREAQGQPSDGLKQGVTLTILGLPPEGFALRYRVTPRVHLTIEPWETASVPLSLPENDLTLEPVTEVA